VAVLAALVNFIHLTGLTLVVGAVALRYLVMTRSGLVVSERAPALRDAGRYGLIGAAAVLLMSPARALFQASALSMPGDDLLSLTKTVYTTTALGRALLLQAIWAAAAAMAFSVARMGRQRGWSAAAIATLVLAIVPALSGHAAAADPVIPAQVAVVVHVLGAGVWIGTLATLWRIARKASDATLKSLLEAFHPVALGGAAMLVASGLYQTWSIVERPAQLVTTAWGGLLMAKLAVLCVVLALGYRHWKSAEAQVGSGERAVLRASMQRELTLALLVLLITGALTSTGLE